MSTKATHDHDPKTNNDAERARAEGPRRLGNEAVEAHAQQKCFEHRENEQVQGWRRARGSEHLPGGNCPEHGARQASDAESIAHAELVS